MKDNQIINRWYNPEEDDALLSISLGNDQFHKGTTVDFFKQPGTITKVYELNNKPVLFLRGSKSARLDIQFVDNNDFESNRTVMLEEFNTLVIV